MANKFYGAIGLTGGITGTLDNIDDAVLTDGDGGYVITDSERIYIYHYDTGDTTLADSPRVIKPKNITHPSPGRFLITEAVVKNVVMASNASYLYGTDTGDAEVGLLRINSSDDTEIRAITGQSVDVIINSTKVLDVSASGLQILGAGATIDEFSTDGTMTGDSDTAVPTEKAVAAYVASTHTAFVTLTGAETLTNKTLTTPIIAQINTATGKVGIALTEDGSVTLYEDELRAFATSASGAAIYDTSGDDPYLGFNNDAGAVQGFIRMLNQDMIFDVSGETGIIINEDAGVDLYFNAIKEAETESGYFLATNAFQIAATTNVTGILDDDTMAADSAVSLATQQSIKAYVDTHASDTSTHGVAGTIASVANIATHAALTATHGVLEIVGVSEAQTLTTKTLTTPIINQINTATGKVGATFVADGASALYHNELKILETTVNSVGGISVFSDAGNGEAMLLAYESASAPTGTLEARVHNNKNSGHVVLSGLSSAAALRPLLTGDPDAATTLYFAGLDVLATTSTGIAVLDSSGATPIITFANDAGSTLGYVSLTNTTLNVVLSGENMLLGTADAGLDFYYNNIKEAETESGYFLATNAFQIAAGEQVDIIRDEDTMSSNDENALATQQSIKAYADTKTDAYYETFGSLATWTVNHNLGVANVSVKAIVGGVDVTGTYDEPTITMVTTNQCTVVFSVATAGDVVCIA